jgi:arylsulfatase A
MKLHVTEAGYRVPGIICWPCHARPGTTGAEPICGLDFLPTACALAEVPAPADRALDGTSLLPLFAGQALTLPHPLFWHYDFAPNRPQTLALRDSPWKIPADKKLGQVELYNLSTDLGEKQNVSARGPDRVKAMAATLQQLLAEVAAEGAKFGNPSPTPKRRKSSLRSPLPAQFFDEAIGHCSCRQRVSLAPTHCRGYQIRDGIISRLPAQ